MGLVQGQQDVSYGSGSTFEGGRGVYAIEIKEFAYKERSTAKTVGAYQITSEIYDSELAENEKFIGQPVIGFINNPSAEYSNEQWAQNSEKAVADWAANAVTKDGRSVQDIVFEQCKNADSWFDEPVRNVLALHMPGRIVVTYLKERRSQDGESVFPELTSTLKPFVPGMFNVDPEGAQATNQW